MSSYAKFHCASTRVLLVCTCLLLLAGCTHRSYHSDRSRAHADWQQRDYGHVVIWEGHRYEIHQDRALQDYIIRVGNRLLRRNNRSSRCCRFVVYRHHKPNAFSRVDGTIFLSTGLLQTIENEAQLAAIIGHELAHVLLDHSHQRQSQYSYRFNYRNQFRHLHRLEFAADRAGLEYAARAGYDPRQLIRIFQLVHSHQPRTPQFSTRYPDHQVRLRRIRRTIRSLERRYHSRTIHRQRYSQNVHGRL